MTNPRRIAVPSDLVAWCLVESVAELAKRYGCGTTVICRMMSKLPPEIQEKRRAVITERRLARLAADAAERQLASLKRKSPAPKPQPGEWRTEAFAEANDRFVGHYATVAAARGWRVWQVAA